MLKLYSGKFHIPPHVFAHKPLQEVIQSAKKDEIIDRLLCELREEKKEKEKLRGILKSSDDASSCSECDNPVPPNDTKACDCGR